MKQPRIEGDEDLRAVLRRGDPAGDEVGPHHADWARMRRTILAVAEERPSRRPWLAWASVAAVVVLGVLVGRGVLRSSGTARERWTAPPIAAKAVAPKASRAPITIQFTAPNGTRIYWKLDPDFKL